MISKVDSSSPKQWFTSITVEGGAFADGFRLDLPSRMSALIGPTGSGKTTILELLAFAAQPPSHAASAHVRTNLGTGTLVAHVVAANQRYIVRKKASGERTVTNEQGQTVDVAIERLIPITYYRVHEIAQLGEEPTPQMKILDAFAWEEMHEFATQIAGVERALLANADEQARIEAAIEEKREDAMVAGVVEEKLKGLSEAGGQSADMKAANAASGVRQQERQALTTVLQALGKTREDGARFSAALSRRFTGLVDEALLTGVNADILTRVSAHVATARAATDKALGELGAACEVAEGAVRDRERMLAARHQEQDAAYQKLLGQAKEEVSRSDERKKLQERLATALVARKYVEDLQAERRGAEQKQRELFVRLAELRDRRFARRKELGDRITRELGPHIVVTMKQFANKAAFGALLEGFLKNSGMKYGAIVEKILHCSLAPDELAAYVRRRDAAGLAERVELDVERAKKVIERLSDCKTLCRVEMVELEDEPLITILDGTPKDTNEVSIGQRCSALLSIILAATQSTLLIDQPEDDIQGSFLCNVILPMVRRLKERQQLVFATHNANVVVLGNAERVNAFASTGTQMALRSHGTVDEMKSEIQELEGGPEAFAERMKRYGY
jgi:energy-coupling factor transporter ATP-binding protein EcfA2